MQQRGQVEWWRVTPFLALHAAALLVVFVGWSGTAVAVALAVYFLRVFGLTAFYHRYFAHRSFKTSRWFQFVGALLGSAAAQRGPIWWAAHHRDHHRYAEQPGDVHSPHRDGFLWSHMLWFMTRENFATREKNARDWLKFPELRLLNRFDFVPPALLALGLYTVGELLRNHWPALGTSGWQMLVWGFVISTIALYHVTFAINSLAHLVGSRRFETRDESRNNWWLALLTCGEGWHNNHHFYPASARQGFYWWELDITYSILVGLSWLGIVWDLKGVPQRVFDAAATQPAELPPRCKAEQPRQHPAESRG